MEGRGTSVAAQQALDETGALFLRDIDTQITSRYLELS
jgi:hypothetical protein